MTTLYEILSVAPTATDVEIKTAYRRLAGNSHPDVGGSPALFRLVQEAYEVLSDPTRRQAYDSNQLRITRTPSPPTETAAEKHEREMLARAQSAYTYFAGTCNEANDRAWEAASPTGPNFDQLPTFYAARAEADRVFSRDVATYEWPAEVAPFALELVRATAMEAGVLFRGSLLPGTRTELGDLINELNEVEDEAAEAADAMRNALQLPDKD